MEEKISTHDDSIVVEQSGESDRLAQIEEPSSYLDPPGPSAIASRVRSLKSSVFTVAEKRDRIPQRLFWSLFLSEVDEIKRKKARKRVLNAVS